MKRPKLKTCLITAQSHHRERIHYFAFDLLRVELNNQCLLVDVAKPAAHPAQLIDIEKIQV